jgi:hypothetical protein
MSALKLQYKPFSYPTVFTSDINTGTRAIKRFEIAWNHSLCVVGEEKLAFLSRRLNFWRRILFLILAHPVYKMWIIQEPNTLELWNKRHFEQEKWRVYNMFKIFSTYIFNFSTPCK